MACFLDFCFRLGSTRNRCFSLETRTASALSLPHTSSRDLPPLPICYFSHPRVAGFPAPVRARFEPNYSLELTTSFVQSLFSKPE